MKSEVSMKTDKEYEIEDAARTLVRAEEVKRKPTLYKSAIAHLKKQQSDLEQVVESNDGAKIRAQRRKQVKRE